MHSINVSLIPSSLSPTNRIPSEVEERMFRTRTSLQGGKPVASAFLKKSGFAGSVNTGTQQGASPSGAREEKVSQSTARVDQSAEKKPAANSAPRNLPSVLSERSLAGWQSYFRTVQLPPAAVDRQCKEWVLAKRQLDSVIPRSSAQLVADGKTPSTTIPGQKKAPTFSAAQLVIQCSHTRLQDHSKASAHQDNCPVHANRQSLSQYVLEAPNPSTLCPYCVQRYIYHLAAQQFAADLAGRTLCTPDLQAKKSAPDVGLFTASEAPRLVKAIEPLYKTPKRFVEAIVEIAVGRRVSGYTWLVWNPLVEAKGKAAGDRPTGAIEVMNIPFGQTPLEFGLWPLAAMNMTDSLVTLTIDEANERLAAGPAGGAPAPWTRAARNPLVSQVSIDPLADNHVSFSPLISQRGTHARQWLSCVNWKSVEAELVRALQWYESAEYAAERTARDNKLADEAKRQYRAKIANQEHEKAAAPDQLDAPATANPTQSSNEPPVAADDRSAVSQPEPTPTEVAPVAPEDASEDIKKILNTPVAAEGQSVDAFLSETPSASATEENSSRTPTAEGAQTPTATSTEEAAAPEPSEYRVLESTEDKQVYLMADGTKVVQWLKTGETEWYHNGTDVEVTKQKADGTVEYRYRSGDVVTVPPAVE